MSQENSSKEKSTSTENGAAQDHTISPKESVEENEIDVSGILEILQNKTGQLIDPSRNGKTKPDDPFVPRELIKRFKLKKGSA